ncbi:protein LIFEGUARD 4-like [Magnolia sinica]|uniref:protein LIFEGUARD 4-like n=1 Tax=Magnolia sinica TaxID=86752 RepID=UPI00265B15CE|nr:protein LIFEGUARD 4-like [Magnolia sinica]
MWALTYGKTGDVETGARLLQPMMLESQELRWAFIRKIYSIIIVQMLLTIAVAAIVVTVRPISNFVLSRPGLGLYIFIIILPFIVLCPLYYYSQRHPVNFLLLGLFTVSISFTVGLSCAFTVGKVILESVILTTVVVISLTLYTFWAARRGQDFNFLRTLVFSTISVLMLFIVIQIFFPMGKLSVMIYSGLMKHYKYDEYIWASVTLYLDILNLFLALLSLFRAKSR